MSPESQDSLNGNRLDFEPSAERQLLCKEMMKLEVGGRLTYVALSILIKGDVQRDKRHLLNSARTALLREEHRVFGIIPGVGVYRMGDAQIVDMSAGSVGKIHRLTFRMLRKMACADFANLDNEHKLKHHFAASILGTLAYASSHSTVRKIEAQVVATPKKLDLKDVLNALK